MRLGEEPDGGEAYHTTMLVGSLSHLHLDLSPTTGHKNKSTKALRLNGILGRKAGEEIYDK